MRFILSITFLLALSLAGVRHLGVIQKFRAGVDRKVIVRENFAWRLRGVTIAGAFDRWILRRRRINDVYVLPNGCLMRALDTFEAEPVAEKLLELKRLMAARNTPFLFVQLPPKELVSGRDALLCSAGESTLDSQDRVLELLYGRVDCVNVRPMILGGAEEIERNYLKTDHHWNFEAAFAAFRFLTPVILNRLSLEHIACPQLLRSNWRECSLPRLNGRFLGSNGRRTGPWCVGYDILKFLIPKFSTAISVSIEEKDGTKRFFDGAFEKALLNPEAMKEPESCYTDSGYDVYLGDHARVDIHNENAPVRKTIFIVKDSFAQPLVAWLSTVFSRVIAIDVRLCKRSLVSEISKDAPNLVAVISAWDWIACDMNLTH